jgi:hypothetical protein
MAAGDQQRLIEFEVQTLGSSSVSSGGLQMQQALQAASNGQQQAKQAPGSLFSWSPSSHAAAAQQPQFAMSAMQSAAQSGGFNFSPAASAGSFVFGATPQQ